MQGSPSIIPFEARAKAWAAKLVLIQDLIDIWLKVQGVWQYLEPIFGSEDIMRQMPEEGKLFKKQDGMWRDNNKAILKDVKVCLSHTLCLTHLMPHARHPMPPHTRPMPAHHVPLVCVPTDRCAVSAAGSRGGRHPKPR